MTPPNKLQGTREITEYRVKNSNDRNTERNELNRILAAIKLRLDSVPTSSTGDSSSGGLTLLANASQFILTEIGDTYNLSILPNGITGTEIDFSTFDTDDVFEGSTNLYFTEERAQDAVGLNFNSTLVYDDAAPSFGINLANANTWTGAQTFSGNVITSGLTGYLYGNAGAAVTASTSIPATAITVDTTGFDIAMSTGLQAHLAEVDNALLRSRSTGLLYGGGLTNLGAGVVRIAAGAGSILDNTNPANETFTYVTWSQTDLNLSAADGIYYVYVTSAGTVTSTTSMPVHQEYRESIWLHRVSIRSGVVSGTTSIVMPVQQYGPNNWDVWRALGSIKRGLTLSAASTNLTIAVAAGEVYEPGSNFYTNPKNPHEISYTLKSPATFRHVTQLNAQSTDRTTLDVANYDNGGTITAIPGSSSRAQIFTVKMFPGSGGNIRIFYGQEWYNNVALALEALQTGTYNPVFPEVFDEAVTLGWIITEAGATNLADGTQVFVTANKFGTTGGSLATSGVGALLRVNNLSDLNDVATARTNLGLGSLAVLNTVGTSQIDNDSVTDAKLRNSVGLSVIGRASNTTGDPADIVAGTDGHVLRRSGTTIGFGTIPNTSVTGLGTMSTQNANAVAITGGTATFDSSSIVGGFASVGTAALGASSGGGLLGLTNAHPAAADQRVGAVFFGSRVGATSYYPVSLIGFSAEAWSAGTNLGSYALMQVTAAGSGSRSTVQRWDATGTSITGTLSATGVVTLNGATNYGAGLSVAANGNTGLTYIRNQATSGITTDQLQVAVAQASSLSSFFLSRFYTNVNTAPAVMHYVRGDGAGYFAGNLLVGTTSPPASARVGVAGGRTFLGANNDVYALGLSYSSTLGNACFIGASNSVTPDMIFSNAAGTELARFANSGAVSITGTLTTTGNVTAGGRVTFGTDYYADVNAPNPLLNFDANDYLLYSRGGNFLQTVIGAVEVARQTSTGLSINGTISASNLAGTTYTPTITNVSNVTGSTPGTWFYQRIGNVVFVSGFPSITTSGTSVEFRVSLPVASNFANFQECVGSGGQAAAYLLNGYSVEAATATDDAYVRASFTSSGTVSVPIQFMYRII